VLILVQAVRHFLEGECRGTSRLGERGAIQKLVGKRGDGAGSDQAAQGRPAAQTPLDQFAHRGLGAGVRARILGVDVSGAAQVHPNLLWPTLRPEVDPHERWLRDEHVSLQ
jgi:hypothetical protein